MSADATSCVCAKRVIVRWAHPTHRSLVTQGTSAERKPSKRNDVRMNMTAKGNTSHLWNFARKAAALGCVALVVGCASTNDEVADDTVVIESGDEASSVTTQAYSINLNCASSLPGLPQNPCRPD